MIYLKIGVGVLAISALSGCLTIGTRIGVGSGGVKGGVVLSGSQEVGNGVSIGGSVSSDL